MARYTYLVCDLLTNAVLAELPLSEVEFTVSLNDAGPFSAKLPLSDRRVQKLDPLGSTQPGRTALYVDRDGVLIWGGILWSRKYDSDTRTLEIDGAEFWSYFKRRFITSAVNYSNLDQITIASNLLTLAQSASHGNIGVLVNPDAVTSGVNRDCVHYSFELKPYSEAIEEFATLDDGFDFAIDVSYVGGVPTKIWRPAAPRRGRSVSQSGWVFDYPGNIMGYDYNEDATEQATALYVVGAGEGDDMAQSSLIAQALLDAGYPLLDGSISVKDTTDPVVLASRARAESRAMSGVVTVPEATVRADRDPVLGSYIVGDNARLTIADSARFPTALDVFQRITGFTVTPPEQGSAESVSIAFDQAV
jgi:hypothetical protein